jgi:hypothetical protein
LIVAVCAVQFTKPVYSQNFTDVTLNSGINHVFDYGDFHFGGGVAVLDINADGFDDLYFTGGVNKDMLYKNNGDGTFTNVLPLSHLPFLDSVVTMGVTSADIDNDGDPDLFVTTRCHNDPPYHTYAHNVLLRNNGDETFTDITSVAGFLNDSSFSTAAAFGDYNNDGYIDLYVLNFFGIPVDQFFDSTGIYKKPSPASAGSTNRLYQNNGDGTFTDVTVAQLLQDYGVGWATVFTDYDNDADADVLVANDFGNIAEPNNLYRNEYPATTGYTNQSIASGTHVAMNAMGVAVGDYDGDGWLDYYITNAGSNILHRNNGNGTFSDRTSSAGVENEGWIINGSMHTSVGWGANFFDYDNDTYLDLFVCNGSLNPLKSRTPVDTFYNPNVLYKNNGNGTFADVSAFQQLDDPHRGRGSVVFDYDNDGNMDLLVVNQVHYKGYATGASPTTMLYRNTTQNTNNWIKVKLEGVYANRSAIGARVNIKINDRVNKTYIREIDGGSSHLSQNALVAHIGIGDYDLIDTIEIVWPGGNKQYRYDVEPNQLLCIKEALPDSVPGGISNWANNRKTSLLVYPNPASAHCFVDVPSAAKGPGSYQLVLTAPSGQLVYQTGMTSLPAKIEMRDMQPGMYYAKVYSDGQLIGTGKVLKK